MSSRRYLLNAFVVLLTVSPVIYLLFVWKSIPETITIRFNANEPEVDEHSKQMFMIITIMLSVVAAGIFLLMRNIKRIDPKVKENTPVAGFNRIGILVAVVITALNYFFILSALYSWVISEKAFFIFGGVLFALLGNYMSNIKPNFFAGIRLPWTLSNENNWRRTHHLAGRLWFAGGLVLALLSWLLPTAVVRFVFIGVLTVIVLIPAIYSYRMYKSGNQH